MYYVLHTAVSVDSKYLKSLIRDQGNTTKIRPVLLPACGFPNSGHSRAIDHLLQNYVHVKGAPFTSVRHNIPANEAEGISLYELVAVGLYPRENLTIAEVTQESSFAFGILSAFKEKLLINQQMPFSACTSVKCFDDSELDEHLHYTLEYLHESKHIPKTSQVTEKHKQFAEHLKQMLPEGIALINIRKISSNEVITHFFNAMSGHLYNSHPWLFFNMDDIGSLEKPLPHKQTASEEQTEKNEVHTFWRPSLHYLLRNSRMCVSLPNVEKKRNRVCTMFGRCHDHLGDDNLVKEVEQKVQRAAKHIGVSSLLEPKLEVINLNGGDLPNDYSLHLYHKFLGIIYDTPYHDIPLSWVFLRSLFYGHKEVFISKQELAKKALECGIDDTSFDKFCSFFTSFGSIFDLSLINPNCQCVVVKPMEFLVNLNKLFYAHEYIVQKHDLVKSDIFDNIVCKEVYGEKDWVHYMDALESIGLAAKLKATSIKCESLSCDDWYYYVPFSVKKKLETKSDSNSIFVITSDDSYSVFKLTAIVKHILAELDGAKLVPLELQMVNKAIIEDRAGVQIKIIVRSPVTEIAVSKLSPSICLCIVSTFQKIAKSCKIEHGKYKFVKLCKKSEDAVAKAICAQYRHLLPDDDSCKYCGENDEIIMWNKALQDKVS